MVLKNAIIKAIQEKYGLPNEPYRAHFSEVLANRVLQNLNDRTFEFWGEEFRIAHMKLEPRRNELACAKYVIKRNSKHCSTTAGGATEDVFANLLKHLFPNGFNILKNRKIVDQNGNMSGQIDIVITNPETTLDDLSDAYVPISHVVAAFECKLTLRKNNLKKTISDCRKLKKISPPSLHEGLAGKLFKKIPYGILALSQHGFNISSTSDLMHMASFWSRENNALGVLPSEFLDFIFVSDETCLFTRKELDPFDEKIIDLGLRAAHFHGDIKWHREDPLSFFVAQVFQYIEKHGGRKINHPYESLNICGIGGLCNSFGSIPVTALLSI